MNNNESDNEDSLAISVLFDLEVGVHVTCLKLVG